MDGPCMADFTLVEMQATQNIFGKIWLPKQEHQLRKKNRYIMSNWSPLTIADSINIVKTITVTTPLKQKII